MVALPPQVYFPCLSFMKVWCNVASDVSIESIYVFADKKTYKRGKNNKKLQNYIQQFEPEFFCQH